MTGKRWFKFGMSASSDVKRLLVFLVVLSVLDILPLSCKGEDYGRDPRKFGGYRITPTRCKAVRTAKYNRGNTICMFNHECIQRGGEIVGACMDGFLFGACCQLKSDSQSHIPKGPGVVMTSNLDYPDPETETADYEADELNAWHDSFKPVITPGYIPSKKIPSSTTEKNMQDMSTESQIISEGLSQITSTLLQSPPKQTNIVDTKPEKTDGIYTYSTIDHNVAETILLNENGLVADNVVRPSDFNIQVSAMQTKPTVSPTTTTSTEPSQTVSTHRPVYTKPVFKPKPLNKISTSTTENYIMVSSSSNDNQKVTDMSSINTIMHMLNETVIVNKDVTTLPTILDFAETKSSPGPVTISPVSYSTGYPNYYLSTGHYVTLKPSSYATTTLFSSNNFDYSTTDKPVLIGSKPTYNNRYTTPNDIPEEIKPTTSKPSNFDINSSQNIDIFNRYPEIPSAFGDSVTTFSVVSTTSTTKPTTTTRRPPSTSYVTGSKPITRRPATSPTSLIPSYDLAPDTFSSVTPTVIVLNGLQTSTPVSQTENKEPQFVEISQIPFKKPVSEITVNNHIESTNNIYLNKPPSYDKPSSPTVLITPKPPPITTAYPIKGSTNYPLFDSYPEYYSPSTFKPETQTSPDDLINFPPVRNPLLNATGSNPGVFNTSISLSDNDIDFQDVDFTTPIWQDDEKQNDKMISSFVSKIVGSLQGTFQELHDIVILDKKPNATILQDEIQKPPKKTTATTRKPTTTSRKPVKVTTVSAPTKKPTTSKTTKKPTKVSSSPKRTTTPGPQTTVTPSPKPSKKVTTTAAVEYADEEVTTENYVDQPIDYNDKSLCGVRPLVRNGRIVNGKNAAFGAWPWQVLVRESTWLGFFTKNKCGGVLISNKFVATAAHCQPGIFASLVAVFGEHDITRGLEPKRPVSRNVRRVIVHRSFDAATFENDLALLELDTPIKFDSHIIPVCLPPDDLDLKDQLATVTGWGRLSYGGGVPPILQEVQVPVIENGVCQEMFHTAGHPKKILNSFLCAGYANGQKDACEGDSGGPLVVQRDDGRWLLIGTVSHGIKCAAPYLPGVYMRISYYKPWLRSVTGIH